MNPKALLSLQGKHPFLSARLSEPQALLTGSGVGTGPNQVIMQANVSHP